MFIAVGVSGGEMAIAVLGCQSVSTCAAIAGVRDQHSWIFTSLLSWCLLSLCEHPVMVGERGLQKMEVAQWNWCPTLAKSAF